MSDKAMNGYGPPEANEMTCNECRANFSAYIEGEYAGETRERFELHLEECPECAARLQGTKNIVSVLGALPRERVSDSFTFEMRRRLAREAEREASWLGRFRESVRPTSQTVWAAAVGTLMTLALLFVFGTGDTQQNPMMPSGGVAADGEQSGRDIRYVLEHVPLDGELIEVSAAKDSATVAEDSAGRGDSSSRSDATPVRADF